MGIAIKVKGQNYFKYSGLGKVSFSDIVSGDSPTTPTSKTDRNLSFEGAVVNVTYGSTVNPPSVNGVVTGTKLYTSSDTTLATVNATTGAVTLMDNRSGEVTITLTIAENETYAEGTASYTINITAQSSSGDSGSSSDAVQGALTSYPNTATHLMYILKKTNTFDPSTDDICYIVDMSENGGETRYYYYNSANYQNQTNSATAVAFKKNASLEHASYCDDWICLNIKSGGTGIKIEANATERESIKNGITGYTEKREYDGTLQQNVITWCEHSSREIYQKIQSINSKTVNSIAYPLGLAELVQIKGKTEVANVLTTIGIGAIISYANPWQRLVNVVTGSSGQFMIQNDLSIMTKSANYNAAIGTQPTGILALYNVAVGDSASFADKYSD